jgi:antitoxin MazE
MKIKVVKIGNSKGIRIPKSIIQKSGLKNEAELKVIDEQIIIKPIKANRESWNAAFKKMAKNKDDVLMDKKVSFSQSTWDNKEWEW